MIDIIKKYTKDVNQIKLADEILKEFGQDKDINKKPRLNSDKLRITNFGNLELFELKLNKNINFFTGDTGSGKSWGIEAWLYLLSGSSRSMKGVIGEYDSKMYGELLLNQDLVIKWNRSEKTGKLEIRKGEFIVSTSIQDLPRIIKNYTNVDIELLTSTLYYSPRLSFLFSRKLPHEREALLIKLANLDIWLDLEKFAKDKKKEEKTKLDEIEGVLGYLADVEYTEADLKKQIGKDKKEIEQLDKEIKELKIPDVTKLNTEYTEIREKLEAKSDIAEQISIHTEKNKQVEKNQKEINQLNIKLKALNFSEKKIKELEDVITTKKEELNDMKNKGVQVKTDIEQKKEMTKSATCPILSKECDDLKSNNVEIEKQIVALTDERNKLAEQYKILQKELQELEIKLQTIKSKQTEHTTIKTNIEYKEQALKSISQALKNINIAKLEKDLAKFPGTLKTDLEKLNTKIENINNDIEDKTTQKDEFVDDKTELLASTKDCEQKLKDIVKMEQFLTKKKKLTKRQDTFDDIIKLFGKKDIPKHESKKILSGLNKNINMILDKLTVGRMQQNIDDNFEMSVMMRDKKKLFTPNTISEGEEFVLNLSFLLASGLLYYRNELPLFFCDDCVAFQSDVRAKEIINGLIALQKAGLIKQLYLSSNRLENLKMNSLANRVFNFTDGKYKIKENKEIK